MTFLPSGNDFAEHVLDRLASGLRAKIATHVANNYYSHALLCKEAWSDAKKSAKASKGSSAIPADEILKHLLPHLSKRFPHTVGNSSRARSFLLSFFSSNAEGVSQSSVCQAVQCFYAAKGNADQQKKGYEPNLSMFSDKLAAHPDRLKNIYFTWLFLLRALKKAEPKLADYDLSCGSPEETERTKSLRLRLLKHVQHDDAAKGAFKMLRADKKLFHNEEERARLLVIIRENFHTISQNVDCIACDSCRLQAKVKITGLAFAVRVILNDDLLRETTYGRNDVIAFINTIQQFSKGAPRQPPPSRRLAIMLAINLGAPHFFAARASSPVRDALLQGCASCTAYPTCQTAFRIPGSILKSLGLMPMPAREVKDREAMPCCRSCLTAAPHIARHATARARRMRCHGVALQASP